MRLFIGLLVLLLLGCGQNDSSVSTESPVAMNTEGQPPGIAEKHYYTMAVETEPACNADNDHQLIYIRPLAAFKTCEQGIWVDVPIKGEKGDKGDQGEAGVDGENGQTTVVAAEDSANRWIDPIEGTKWAIGAEFGASLADCSPWRLPSRIEAKTALKRGLSLAIKKLMTTTATTAIWTADIHTTAQRFAVDFALVDQFPAVGIIACIKP